MAAKKVTNKNLERLRVLSDELCKYGSESLSTYISALEKIKEFVEKTNHIEPINTIIEYDITLKKNI